MNLFDPSVRQSLERRLEHLQANSRRQWGTMDAPKMLAHCGDQLRMALGDIATKPVPGPVRYPPLKQFALYVMPWPKGKLKAPPEGFTTDPADWHGDKAKILDLIDRFCATDPAQTWPPNPVLGRLSGRGWGTLSAKHLDHHLRQFGH